jgi:hypothetical protein
VPTSTGTPAEVSAAAAARWPARCARRRPSPTRDAVDQVRAAQGVGDVGGLDRRRAEHVHLGAPSSAPSTAASRRCSTDRAAPRRPSG